MATADTIKISDGTTDIDLILDDDGFEMLAGGAGFGISNHNNLYHESDFLPGQMLVRESAENKIWSFKLAIRGTTDDAIINTIVAFNKMVRQARSYHIDGDVEKVYLYIKLEGATHATYYDIIDIQPKGLGLFNYINRNIGEVIFDGGLSIDIVTEPFGYGSIVMLENELNNAHFEVDTDSDGLANAWTEIGSPVTTLPTDVKFVGSQSQKVVTSDDSSEEGVVHDTVACTTHQGEDFAVFCWISTSGDDVDLHITGDDSGTIDHVSTGGAIAAVLDTKTVDGTAWVKIGVVGTVGASDTTLAFRVERFTAAAITTFYVDACYLQWTSTLPSSGWMSYKHILNYHDTTFGNINYIDVADIGGDVEAKTRITASSDVDIIGPTIWLGKRTKDNVYYRATLDSTEEDSTPTSTTADGDYSFGEYSNYTLTSTGLWNNFMYWSFPDTTNALNFNGKFMLILVGPNRPVHSFDSGVYFKAQYAFSTNTRIAQTEPVLGNGMDMLELGVLDLPPGFNDTSGTLLAHRIRVLANNDTGSSVDISVDYLLMMPLSDYRIVKRKGYVISSGEGYTDDGIITNRVYHSTAPGGACRDSSIFYGLGDKITLDPTKKERLTMLWLGVVGDAYTYNPQHGCDMRIEYQPRTEFLIGT